MRPSVAVVLAALGALGSSPWGLLVPSRLRSLVRLRSPAAAPGPPGRRGGSPSDGPEPEGADPVADVRVDLPVLLDLLISAARTGADIPRALTATGDAVRGGDGAALRRAGRALVLGSDWEEAWRDAPPRLLALAEGMRPAWDHGSSIEAVLRVAGEAIRQEQTGRARTAAARLGVRLVLPLGLCFLPAFVLIGLVPILLSIGTGMLRG